MRLPPRRKMRPNSPALHAKGFRFPNQTPKEPRFPWWNCRESPRTLSQDEKNIDVTSGMQNRLVYSKLTQDETHFHSIGSVAIPRSTSYKTGGLTSFRKIQRFPETPISSLEELNFSKATGGKFRAPHIIWRWELIPCLQLKRLANFPQATQEEFSLRNMHVGSTLCFLLQVKWTPSCTESKEGRIYLQRLNAGSSFISPDERMSESPVETLQKALGLQLILTRVFRSLWHLERKAEFSASKVDDAWHFLNIVKNPNITVPTRKWPSLSCLTSRRVRIVLSSLV